MLLSAISAKKPGSLKPLKKESRRRSAASLSKKKKWTPGFNACSSLDAHSLDCSRRQRFRRHQDFPHLGEPTVRTIYKRIHSLRIAPNRGKPGHRTSTRELALTPLPYVAVYSVKTESRRNPAHLSRRPRLAMSLFQQGQVLNQRRKTLTCSASLTGHR